MRLRLFLLPRLRIEVTERGDSGEEKKNVPAATVGRVLTSKGKGRLYSWGFETNLREDH